MKPSQNCGALSPSSETVTVARSSSFPGRKEAMMPRGTARRSAMIIATPVR